MQDTKLSNYLVYQLKVKIAEIDRTDQEEKIYEFRPSAGDIASFKGIYSYGKKYGL